VTVDGGDVVITGAGVKEIRLKPGQYKVAASKDGKVIRQELVTVSRNGRQVVRISKEAEPAGRVANKPDPWEKSVAELPPEQQVEAVARRLKERNPRFDGRIEPTIRDSVVLRLEFCTDQVSDISPLRALKRLEALDCRGTADRQGKLADLSPLRGLSLTYLNFTDNPVSDLSPLVGMPLRELVFFRTEIKDLALLKGMPLTTLAIGHTRVADLSPLKEMKLAHLYCDQAPISDLSPLRGMPLKALFIPRTRVSDLSPLRGMPLTFVDVASTPVSDLSVLQGMPLKEIGCDFQSERDAKILRSLMGLEKINGKPAAEFWKEVDGK
jgi:Leucine-rich repeat (LRR) protein